jgi:hypothetical protein
VLTALATSVILGQRLAPEALYDRDEGLDVGLLVVADAHEVLVGVGAHVLAEAVEDAGVLEFLLVEAV